MLDSLEEFFLKEISQFLKNAFVFIVLIIDRLYPQVESF